MAEDFRRLIDLAHGQNDAKYGSHDAKARQGVGDLGHGPGGDHGVVVHGGDVGAHEVVVAVGVDALRQQALDVVADEKGELLVFGDGGVFVEGGGLGRFGDVGLKGHNAVAAGDVDQFKQEREQIEIVAGRGFLAGKDVHDVFKGAQGNGLGRGDEKGAKGRSADDEQFDGLKQHAHMAAFQQEAAEDAAKNHHNADYREHGPPYGRAMAAARESSAGGGLSTRRIVSKERAFCA